MNRPYDIYPALSMWLDNIIENHTKDVYEPMNYQFQTADNVCYLPKMNFGRRMGNTWGVLRYMSDRMYKQPPVIYIESFMRMSDVSGTGLYEMASIGLVSTENIDDIRANTGKINDLASIYSRSLITPSIIILDSQFSGTSPKIKDVLRGVRFDCPIVVAG